jgi:Family of unknown function (DUF5681)
MTANPSANGNNGRKRSVPGSTTAASGEEYKVGPGCPPREFQFKPGQSGNPKGAKRKAPSIKLDLKALFESALNEKVTLKQGEREQIVTMWASGMKQLATQFAKGDRHARRDVFMYADKLGVNLIASQHEASQEALAPDYQAILHAYVRRQYDTTPQPSRVFAPPELLDDDSDDQNRK